jgi:hypothetical protein
MLIPKWSRPDPIPVFPRSRHFEGSPALAGDQVLEDHPLVKHLAALNIIVAGRPQAGQPADRPACSTIDA